MNGLTAGVLVALLSSSAAQAQQPQSLDEARFAELRRELTPDPDALWRSIPWRIDLLAAQREAARERLPLFVWAMDGHPLGCT